MLDKGRKRVLDAEDIYYKGPQATCPADVLRAAQYNLMLRELGVSLEKWATNLNHEQRKDILDALDWHRTGSLSFRKDSNGEIEFVVPPDGQWPTRQMSLEAANEKFDKLQSIRWLKLPPVSIEANAHRMGALFGGGR